MSDGIKSLGEKHNFFLFSDLAHAEILLLFPVPKQVSWRTTRTNGPPIYSLVEDLAAKYKTRKHSGKESNPHSAKEQR